MDPNKIGVAQQHQGVTNGEEVITKVTDGKIEGDLVVGEATMVQIEITNTTIVISTLGNHDPIGVAMWGFVLVSTQEIGPTSLSLQEILVGASEEADSNSNFDQVIEDIKH